METCIQRPESNSDQLLATRLHNQRGPGEREVLEQQVAGSSPLLRALRAHFERYGENLAEPRDTASGGQV